MGQLKGTRPYLLLKLTLSNNFDYEEICALISKMTTFHIMILVDFEWKWKISQMDVKNSLNGDIREDVYMIPPPSIVY